MGHILCGWSHQSNHSIGADDLHLFMKMLDDKQLQEEDNARDFDGEVKNPTFPAGKMWLNPDTNQEVPYESMRWSVFRNTGSENMFNMIRQNVFEFIKHIGTGEESAYSRYMKTAIFLIPNARTLTKIVDGVDALDMNNRDAMGDVYEYILGKWQPLALMVSSAHLVISSA